MRSHEYYKILKITKPTFEVKNKVVFTKTIKSLVRERERETDRHRQTYDGKYAYNMGTN